MLASRVSGKRVLVVLATVTITIALPRRHAPPPASLPPPAPRAVVAPAPWHMQIAHVFKDCTGPTVVANLGIESDGSVLWRAPDMPDRHLQVTPAQLATLRSFDRLDAKRTDEVGWGGGEQFRIGTSGNIYLAEGERIWRHSTRGEALATWFDEVLGAYYKQRFTALEPIAVDLALDGYQLELRGTDLEVRRGKRTWLREERDISEVVDLVDFVTQGTHRREGKVAFGTLRAAGITAPVAASRSEHGALEFIAAGFAGAKYEREQR